LVSVMQKRCTKRAPVFVKFVASFSQWLCVSVANSLVISRNFVCYDLMDEVVDCPHVLQVFLDQPRVEFLLQLDRELDEKKRVVDQVGERRIVLQPLEWNLEECSHLRFHSLRINHLRLPPLMSSWSLSVCSSVVFL